jgi:hypothetical protein
MTSMATQDMAKQKADKTAQSHGPKAQARERDDERKPLVAQLRGSVEFKQWLEELVEFDARPLSMILERALKRYAKEAGFEKEAPKR